MSGQHGQILDFVADRAGLAALATPLKAQEIAIAVAGPVASIGEQMKRGAETAAAAIDDAGGVSANPEMAARPPVRTRNLVEEP